MPDRVARRVIVHGRVQGVNFRAATRQAARDAGVDGWVSNADDGTVHAHLEGPATGVEQVVAFVRSGPSHADVDHVDIDTVAPEGVTGFRIR